MSLKDLRKEILISPDIKSSISGQSQCTTILKHNKKKIRLQLARNLTICTALSMTGKDGKD